jgi:opacity protein-like surface antigen
MRAKWRLVTVALLGVLAVRAAPASAEWFGDLYLGGAFTQNHDLTAAGALNGTPLAITAQDLRFDSSVMGGGRFGYWLNALPFGLALDVSYFEPSIRAQSVNTNVSLGGTSANVGPLSFGKVNLSVTDLSFDLMLRWPGLLASPQFPNGRLQPYVAAGPALFFVTAKDSTNFGPPDHQSSSDTVLGVKAGFGTTWMLTPSVGLFAEYRYTHFSPTFDFNTNLPGLSRMKVETDVNTHHVLVGVTFRF